MSPKAITISATVIMAFFPAGFVFASHEIANTMDVCAFQMGAGASENMEISMGPPMGPSVLWARKAFDESHIAAQETETKQESDTVTGVQRQDRIPETKQLQPTKASSKVLQMQAEVPSEAWDSSQVLQLKAAASMLTASGRGKIVDLSPQDAVDGSPQANDIYGLGRREYVILDSDE